MEISDDYMSRIIEAYRCCISIIERNLIALPADLQKNALEQLSIRSLQFFLIDRSVYYEKINHLLLQLEVAG
ncbi:hypothetical protein GP2143_03868 [marine gamma proteobacterium HTCC2143]|jgi:hypothetical protein|uniref:Uncharacterized protein n=1 Tax=marine gamma proteobacterium HTCC2143 TaxID=247633 RepID=A0YDC5_9GAMM|nr:hypothetical protein GP2143_03868 [marine gamma proteobacterium HTCC2143]